MQRSKGFTMIELATTVATLAVCAGIALPSMGGLLERHQASAAIASLSTHMAMARNTAITRGKATAICPTRDGTSCHAGTDWSHGWLLFLDEDGNRKVDAASDILRADMAPTAGRLAVNGTVGRYVLRYLPSGRSSGTNLTVSVCSKRGDLLGQVVVNNVGRARTARPAAATPCPR